MIRAAIPIAGVAQVAFNLVQHGMNPRGGSVIFVLLHGFMSGVPFAGESEFNRAEQFVFRCAHDDCFTAATIRLQAAW